MPLEQHPLLGVRYVQNTRELGAPDLVILPGTKNTVDDLLWLRQSGLEAAISELASRYAGAGRVRRLPDARRDAATRKAPKAAARNPARPWPAAHQTTFRRRKASHPDRSLCDHRTPILRDKACQSLFKAITLDRPSGAKAIRTAGSTADWR